MKKKILNNFMLLLLLLVFQSYSHTSQLFWPMKYWGENAKDQVTSAFGPRDGQSNWFHYGVDIQKVPGTTDQWTLINPYNEAAKIVWYQGATDVQWALMAPWNSASPHPVKNVIFWHTNNSGILAGYDSKQYSSKAVLDVKMKDLTAFANHCHFETMTDITNKTDYPSTTAYANRIMKTKNPLQWLDYDHTYEGTWGFGNAANGTPAGNRYVQYSFLTVNTMPCLKITTAEHKRALSLNRITINVINEASYSWEMGNCFYDMNERLSPIFRDLAIQTAPNTYENKEYECSQVDAKPWGSVDAEKKLIDWYFYKSAGFSSSTKFQVQIQDVSGGTWTSSTFMPPTGVCPPGGCPPNTPANPPTSLTATTTANGILLQWSPVSFEGEGGYLIYRRAASTPNIQSARPLILVGKWQSSYLDVMVDGNPVTGGVQYKYSIATVNPYGESCNGPFVSGCSGCNCAVDEKIATMPIADIQVASGYFHNLLLKSDGGVSGCGSNLHGQLGLPTTGNYLSRTGIITGIKSIAANYYQSFMLKTDGSLWATGTNYYGQLGDGTTLTRTTPTLVMTGVRSVACGTYHTLILKTDGTLWACGNNNRGQLGDGTLANRASPVQVMSDVQSMAAGSYHSIVLKSDRTLWAFGANTYGQLATGATSGDVTTPTQTGLLGAVKISAGDSYTYILKGDNTLWACGYNGYGQFGDGTNVNSALPKQCLTGVRSMKAGVNFSFILKTDQTLWTCGQNTYGQLGNGTTTASPTPSQIMAGVLAISGGTTHGVALKTDNTYWSWGKNTYGQLGDGTTTQRLVPVKMAN